MQFLPTPFLPFFCTRFDYLPELQRLRAQCVRLGRRLQALSQRFLQCQEELDEQQARGAPPAPSVEAGLLEPASMGEEAPCGEESEHGGGSRQPTGGDPQVGPAPLQASGAACGPGSGAAGPRGWAGGAGPSLKEAGFFPHSPARALSL